MVMPKRDRGKKTHADLYEGEEVTITLRLPKGLREAFRDLARRNESTISQEIRKYIRRYVAESGQMDLFGGKK